MSLKRGYGTAERFQADLLLCEIPLLLFIHLLYSIKLKYLSSTKVGMTMEKILHESTGYKATLPAPAPWLDFILFFTSHPTDMCQPSKQ